LPTKVEVVADVWADWAWVDAVLMGG
jgi:hypothetical protein